jgi:nucleoside-diphosphate-sugar epimerase
VHSIVITGAGGALGRRVVAAVATATGVDHVVALDSTLPAGGPTDPPVVSLAAATTTVERRRVALEEAPLAALLGGATAVVHLGVAALDESPVAEDPAATVAGVRRLLDAAGKADLAQLVIVSSATVYGAWPSNPVPLTEDAAVRPNPGFGPVTALAEVERLVRDWRDGHPSARVAVLRPAATVAPDRPGWLARSLRAALAFPVDGRDPATQFLHLDDLVGAVDLALRERLDGVFNVAPDGWMDGNDRRSLDQRPRLRLPEAWARKVAGWRWRLGTAPTPPQLLPYVTHPWVVANGRLRDIGWQPVHTNEEAWVDAHPGGPLATLSPRRRQELILGSAAALGLSAAAGIVAVVRRRRRGQG